MDCKLTADDGVSDVYLGRPWKPFAKTVFLNCDMGGHIRPEGWFNWNKKEAEKTVFYAECGSKGPGAVATNRVKWSKQLKVKQLKGYELGKMLSGSDNWRPWKR